MNKKICEWCYYARMKTDICGIYCTGGFENPDGTCDHFRDSRTALTERTVSMETDKLIEALERDCSQCARYGKAYNPPCLRCSGFKKNFRWVGGTQDELRAKVAEAFKAQAAQLAELQSQYHKINDFSQSQTAKLLGHIAKKDTEINRLSQLAMMREGEIGDRDREIAEKDKQLAAVKAKLSLAEDFIHRVGPDAMEAFRLFSGPQEAGEVEHDGL